MGHVPGIILIAIVHDVNFIPTFHRSSKGFYLIFEMGGYEINRAMAYHTIGKRSTFHRLILSYLRYWFDTNFTRATKYRAANTHRNCTRYKTSRGNQFCLRICSRNGYECTHCDAWLIVNNCWFTLSDSGHISRNYIWNDSAQKRQGFE